MPIMFGIFSFKTFVNFTFNLVFSELLIYFSEFFTFHIFRLLILKIDVDWNLIE